MASMLAAKKIYPEARIVFPGSQERTLREFLVQSTFYIFEVDRVRDVDLEEVDTLILVDTRQKGRIGPFAEVAERPGVRIHIYDHHPPSEDDLKGEVEVVREVGATSTIMVDELRRKGIRLSPDEATVLATGIYEDTGSLTFSSTTEEDFMAMAYLRSVGAKLSVISDLITRELTAEQVFLLNDLIRSARKIRVKGVEIVLAKASSDRYVGDFAVLVHKLRDMENIDVLFALARMEDRVYLVARSRIEAVNVGQIALAFGGGGHATAASATIRDLTLIQVEERLLKLLEETVRPSKTASDIMSFPVKTIQAHQALREAGAILSRHNINVLPVMEGERLVGLISRVIVQRAAYHGLEDLPVREYMTTEFVTAEPETPVEEVRRLIVENAQRFLPVMEGERLVGAVTRTDILREMEAQLGGAILRGPDREGEGFVRKKDIRRLMEERLPEPILEMLREIGRVAEEMRYHAYVVGGFVRDLLLRVDNLDVDVVVEGDGIRFAQRFAESRGCRLRSHQKFGTAVIIFPDGFKVDVATARTEYYERPAALPTVEMGSIKLDLYRRDFTINALAVRLNPVSAFGQLLDFFGGQRDLKDRTLRVLHNLSLVEDPTRVLRAVRFEQRFGFRIGKHTLNLIQNAVRMNFLERVEGHRLWHELRMLLEERSPILGLRRLAELDVLRFIHPRLKLSKEKERLLQEVEGVLSWYGLLYLDEEMEPWRVHLMALLDRLNDRQVRETLQRLGFHRRELGRIASQKLLADRTLPLLSREKGLVPSQVFRLLRDLEIEPLLYMVAKAEDQRVKRHLTQHITHYRQVRPELNGEDLKSLGMKPGPIFRETLDALRDARLDGWIRSREDEIAFVKARFLSRQRSETDAEASGP